MSDQKQPNIIVIMGDDIGMWNIGAYHRGLMAGTTPNIDKLAAEGAIFTDYYAEASCTAGRQRSDRLAPRWACRRPRPPLPRRSRS
jgi:arylsulfatase A-like enzyme